MASVWGCILTLIAFVGSFSTVRLQMCPQISCLKEGKITVAAFVWLFSTVGFQMLPQMACLRRCIVTLVAFVWLFSTMRFQMFLQSTCIRGSKVALLTFVCLFSTVHFWMSPQIACMRKWIVTLTAFLWFIYIVSCMNLNFKIGIDYTGIITHNSIMFIHYHLKRVVSGVTLVGNWEKIWITYWHWSGRTKLESEIHNNDEGEPKNPNT